MYKPTVTLTVQLRSDGGRDRLGNDVAEWADSVDVPGCLFAPGTPAEVAGQDRPEGASVAATAYFPRGWRGYLKGGRVKLGDGKWMYVIGEPAPYPDGTVPGPWDTYVLLGRSDG